MMFKLYGILGKAHRAKYRKCSWTLMWWVSSFNPSSSTFKKKMFTVYHIDTTVTPVLAGFHKLPVRCVHSTRGLHCSFAMVWLAHFHCSLLGSWVVFTVTEVNTVLGRIGKSITWAAPETDAGRSQKWGLGTPRCWLLASEPQQHLGEPCVSGHKTQGALHMIQCFLTKFLVRVRCLKS